MPRQRIAGTGHALIPVEPHSVWKALLDPKTLAAIIPGARTVEQLAPMHFRAILSLGVGPFRADYTATLQLTGDEPTRFNLRGASRGKLGWGDGTGTVTLRPRTPSHTIVEWTYQGSISGPVTLAGGPILGTATRFFVTRFFTALATRLSR